jgi:hypothetical protein
MLYIFTAIDCFSRYAIAIPIPNKESETVARCIVNDIFLGQGCADLLSDRGGEFVNHILEAIVKIAGVDKFRTSALKPSTNGKVERFHRTFNGMLAKAVNEAQTDWSDHVRYLTFCYNTCCHASTGLSPHFLMTGHEPRRFVDFCLENPDDRAKYETLPAYARHVTDTLEKAYDLVRAQLQVSAENNRKWYNRKFNEVKFTVGQKVRVFIPRKQQGKNPKLESFYKSLATVVKCVNDVTYLLSCPDWRDDRIVHADKIKPVYDIVDDTLTTRSANASTNNQSTT